MRNITIAIALFGLAGTAAAAQAESPDRPCTDKPASAYLSFDALSAKVAGQGYDIRGGEIEKTCGEFDVVDQAGKRAELRVDPTSGVIVANDEEDDD